MAKDPLQEALDLPSSSSSSSSTPRAKKTSTPSRVESVVGGRRGRASSRLRSGKQAQTEKQSEQVEGEEDEEDEEEEVVRESKQAKKSITSARPSASTVSNFMVVLMVP